MPLNLPKKQVRTPGLPWLLRKIKSKIVPFSPNVTREVIRYGNFVVIIPVLIK
jgi:hypothetical protein